jgi:hypothetical protein
MSRRPWIWLVYVVLFALSIPWYLPADDTPAIWLGLPYWVVVSLMACFAIACFTAFVVQRCWPDDEPEDGA